MKAEFGCAAMQGHALFYGRGDLADEYFDKLGYTLPYRVNVADFILDLSSADVYTESRYCLLHSTTACQRHCVCRTDMAANSSLFQSASTAAQNPAVQHAL